METNNMEDTLYNEVGNYYLNNVKLHDVQFIVGEEKEKIKAVRLPLINQSKTWWSMLSEESPLAEKDDIHLPDIEPEVFTLLLKHSYGGLSNLNKLTDDVVMKLCYCANKYFMTSLMEKIAARLCPKNVEELFPALHCLVYYNLQGVEEHVKKIVQTQTTKILDHSDFIECDVDSVTYICKEETLSCDELSLWKAVVEWAKHKAHGSEGTQLRQWMSLPLQHIRLLTLSATDLQDHVFVLEVLNSKEIASICKRDFSLTSLLCCEKSSRCSPSRDNSKGIKVDVLQKAGLSNAHCSVSRTSISCFITKNNVIELQSIVIRGIFDETFARDYKELLFSGYCVYDILSIKITNMLNNTSAEEPVVVRVKDLKLCYFGKVTVPTLVNNKGIVLQPRSKYKVELSFGTYAVPSWNRPDCTSGHDFDHGTFYCSLDYSSGVGLTPCHILQFTYSLIDE